MSVNISGFGARGRIVASKTFPTGFDVTAFSDDQDAFDFPELTVADTAMGLNGTMVVWSKAIPLDITLSMIPDTIDDINLSILLEANRLGNGKNSARDIITLSLIYPSGATTTLDSGIIISGTELVSVSNAGRYKSKTFKFRFENLAVNRPAV